MGHFCDFFIQFLTIIFYLQKLTLEIHVNLVKTWGSQFYLIKMKWIFRILLVVKSSIFKKDNMLNYEKSLHGNITKNII